MLRVHLYAKLSKVSSMLLEIILNPALKKKKKKASINSLEFHQLLEDKLLFHHNPNPDCRDIR